MTSEQNLFLIREIEANRDFCCRCSARTRLCWSVPKCVSGN
ncbi:MAG: hypothetical protein WC540_09580 [Sulfuritalea sp.]